MRHLEIRLKGVVQVAVLAALPVNEAEGLLPELHPKPGRVPPRGVNVEKIFDDDEIGLVLWLRLTVHAPLVRYHATKAIAAVWRGFMRNL